jgi:hypothetical protein
VHSLHESLRLQRKLLVPVIFLISSVAEMCFVLMEPDGSKQP